VADGGDLFRSGDLVLVMGLLPITRGKSPDRKGSPRSTTSLVAVRTDLSGTETNPVRTVTDRAETDLAGIRKHT